jgi:hypothetical protein
MVNHPPLIGGRILVGALLEGGECASRPRL